MILLPPRWCVVLLAGLLVCAGFGSDAQPGAPATTPSALSPPPPPPPPAVRTPPPLEPQRPLDGYVPGVANFGFVTGDVWRGAEPSSEGFRTLAAMGVRTVIDLQEVDQSAKVPPGVRYVPLRVSGWHADEVDTDAVLRAI